MLKDQVYINGKQEIVSSGPNQSCPILKILIVTIIFPN